MLPNFLVVGAEKAGTTTLAAMLAEHPDVFMCEPKEPRFFTNHNWGQGLGWYERLFDGADEYRAVGEASPAYTWAPESSETPKRIYECLGDIRYVYIVRHPVDRMISHYRHALFHQWIPEKTTFEEALTLRPGLKNCSRYYYQIEHYMPYTTNRQWHIVVFEELLKNSPAVAREMFEFLNIDESYSVPLSSENRADQNRRLPNSLAALRSFKRVLPEKVVNVGRHLAGGLRQTVKRPHVPEDVRASLMDELEADLEKLSDFSGKDLASMWQ